MPELPEVETVRRGLLPVLEGARIARAEVRRDGLRWPFPDRLAERLTGQTVRALRRRSKYILADLSGGETLLLHLGMSGRILIDGGEVGEFHHPAGGPHDHVELRTGAGHRIIFNDPRRFGALDLFPTGGGHWLLDKLGPEPLGNEFNEAYLTDRLKGRKMPIKTALLDQRIVAGLGNIYVCEALWRTGISPLRKAGQIAVPRLIRLVPTIRDVLSEAIAAGGSSLRDYRQTDGDLGYFQHSFAVYGREGEACQTLECTGKIRRTVQSGRSTFHCRACQR